MAKLRYLADVNVLVARFDEAHKHHRAAATWFATPGLQWALCPFTEAGFLRYATSIGNVSMGETAAVLDGWAQHPGYRYHPVADDWRTLTKPFSQRLHGHKQVTDAYLLGMAIHDGLVLATFDQALLHLAGEHSQHVHILSA